MTKSVRTRVAFRYTLLFGLLSLSISIAVYQYLQHDAYVRLDNTVQTLLGVIEVAVNHEIVEHGSKESGEQSLREVLKTVYQISFPQEQIAVWDGDRLVGYKPSLGRKQHDLRQLHIGNESSLLSRQDLRIATATVYAPSVHTRYRVSVSTWRGDTQSDLAALFGGLQVIIPLSLLVVSGAGYLLARRTLAPVTEMAQTIDAITSSNLNQRVTVHNSNDEVGRLATGFNDLLERLQKAFGQQRQFMADASHELRTPVSAALTAAQVTLRDTNRSPEQYREALQIVEEQMLRLRRIVEDMFLLARADTASVKLRSEEFYLDELVSEACRAMRLLAHRAGVVLELMPALPEVRMRGDAGLVRQAIIILLDNACKYNRAGGLVKVSLTMEGDCPVLRVTDTGSGIPEEARSHVFERFYRVDSSRARPGADGFDHGSGAGLGLAIAKWIADEHHGSLMLERSSSKGSAFALRFNRAREPMHEVA